MRIRTFAIHAPRHPLLRTLALICGVVILIGLFTVGLVVGTAVLAVLAVTLLIRRWWLRLQRSRSESTVIEGEYTVVHRSAIPHTD